MARAQWIDELYRRRAQVIDRARELARSGEYLDHRALIPQLEHLDGYLQAKDRLEDPAIRAQLDRLCSMARNPTATKVSLKALRALSGTNST